MINSRILAEALMASENCSKYRVSQILGVSRQAAYNWFDGSTKMSTDTALQAAKLLGWNEKVVLAWLIAEAHQGTLLGPELANLAHQLQKELAPDLGVEFQQELPLAS